MRKLFLTILLPFALFFISNANAGDEPVKFKNIEHEQRYQLLIEEIRCLVCQNQSLADSHADLAQDLRKEIVDMIVSGKQDEEIIQFLVERYGDFVLYRPPLRENTWLLWFGPFLFLMAALIAAIVLIRKQSKSDNVKTEINVEQEKRLAELLSEDSSKEKK
jgi:cytochrome c-type biogenesis protein CcmH